MNRRFFATTFIPTTIIPWPWTRVFGLGVIQEDENDIVWITEQEGSGLLSAKFVSSLAFIFSYRQAYAHVTKRSGGRRVTAYFLKRALAVCDFVAEDECEPFTKISDPSTILWLEALLRSYGNNLEAARELRFAAFQDWTTFQSTGWVGVESKVIAISMGDKLAFVCSVEQMDNLLKENILGPLFGMEVQVRSLPYATLYQPKALVIGGFAAEMCKRALFYHLHTTGQA